MALFSGVKNTTSLSYRHIFSLNASSDQGVCMEQEVYGLKLGIRSAQEKVMHKYTV